MSLLRPPWLLLPLLSEPLTLWLLIMVLTVLSTILAYLFFVSGLRYMEAGKATLVAAVEPVVAIILAIIFLGETLSLVQIVGVIAVLTAIRGQA